MRRGFLLRRGSLIVAALAMGALMASCDSVLPVSDGGVPIEDVDTEPRPAQLEWEMEASTGPVVQVMSGTVEDREYQLIVHASTSGACLAFGGDSSSGGGCGAVPGEGVMEIPSTFGMLGWGGGDGSIVEVNGMVASTVERVWVETSRGERATATLVSLEPAEIDAQAFVAFLPSGVEPLAVAAETGGVVDRFEFERPP